MGFFREAIHQLNKWKQQPQRTPLILRGARQVGKTYLVREFSKTFSQLHEFNFQKDPTLSSFFKVTNNPNKILSHLSLISESNIDPNQDLIFFDEIQDCPEALNSLKFFAEDYPNIHIVAAGSLLGVYLSQHTFPVGKVEFINLYPLSFNEFLKAIGKNQLAELNSKLSADINAVHEILVEALQHYFIIGGMPKVISTYLLNHDFNEARIVQENLLTSYRGDFAKYSGSVDALRILSLFENIPKQLAKDNRKFQFKLLKPGSRYAEFSSSINWLEYAGLVHRIPIISHAEIPLKVQQNENIFKLYFFDTGLLGALAELPISAFADKNELFRTFKGAFTENFFVQDFVSQRNESLYCWQGKTSEVDFLFNKEMDLFPIEVKSGESGKLKSLNVFSEKYPTTPWRTRCSLRLFEIRDDTKMRNIPLYQAGLV